MAAMSFKMVEKTEKLLDRVREHPPKRRSREREER